MNFVFCILYFAFSFIVKNAKIARAIFAFFHGRGDRERMLCFSCYPRFRPIRSGGPVALVLYPACEGGSRPLLECPLFALRRY